MLGDKVAAGLISSLHYALYKASEIESAVIGVMQQGHMAGVKQPFVLYVAYYY